MAAFKTIAVFGGGFDPIHIAHEAILTALAKLPEVEKTLLIPYYQSTFDKDVHSSAKHRLNMALLTAKNFQNVFVDEREAKVQTPSYTIDTLQSLKKDYPEHALLLILSTESLANFVRWKDWRTILRLTNIAVFKRRSFPSVTSIPTAHHCREIDELWQKQCGRIAQLPTTIPDVSSTIIRKAIQDNQPFSHWLNPSVHAYLEAHDLYRGPTK